MPQISPPGRSLLVSLLALAACAVPPDMDRTDGVEPLPVGAVGGLDSDQIDALRGLGIPLLVPGDVGDFVLDEFQAETDGTAASYTLGYRRADGACFEVTGTNEGLGGPEWPIVTADVFITDLGRRTRVYHAADTPGATSAQVWGTNTVVSDFIDLDGASVLFISDTQGGCRPLPFDEGIALVSGLRRLPTGPIRAPDATTDLGAFAPADDLLDGYNAASTPEAAAQAIARRYEGEADLVEVQILSERSYEAVALVTALGLADDSVRDERLRLTYAPYGDTWELVAAGRQTRCQPGRGHTTWSDARCQ